MAGELLGPVGGGLLLPASVLLHIPGIIMQTVDTRECPLSSVAINWCQVRDGVLSSAIARGKSTKSKCCKIVSVKAGEGLHVCGLSSSPRARTDTSRDRDT